MKLTMPKIIALLASAVTIAAITAAASAFGQRRPTIDDRMAIEPWEYLVVAGGTTNFTSSGSATMRKEPSGSFGRESYPVEANLDKLGMRGWELVAVSGNPADPVYYFKRRK